MSLYRISIVRCVVSMRFDGGLLLSEVYVFFFDSIGNFGCLFEEVEVFVNFVGGWSSIFSIVIEGVVVEDIVCFV